MYYLVAIHAPSTYCVLFISNIVRLNDQVRLCSSVMRSNYYHSHYTTVSSTRIVHMKGAPLVLREQVTVA